MKVHLFIFFVILNLSVLAQKLYPITHDNSRVSLHQNKNLFSERLHLPFFDDFAQQSNIPDTLLWKKNGGTYVNNNFCWRPPSFGVATFDGITSDGIPYSLFDPSLVGKTDVLESNRIDLSNNPQNVFFSFYVQPSGLGFVQPNPGDSLFLFFLDTANTWNKIWSMYQDSIQEFKFVTFKVEDSKYLFSNFQFKFESFGNKSGMYDVWNIDYVYLDKNRDSTSFMKDIAISKGVNSYLKNYTAMPYDQFLVNPAEAISDSIYISINDFKNNGGNPIPFTKECNLTEINSNNSNQIFSNIAIINNLDKQYIISTGTSNLNFFNDNNKMEIKSNFNIITSDPTKGDTISAVIPDTINTDKGDVVIGVGDEVILNGIYYQIEQGLNLSFQIGDTFYMDNDTLQVAIAKTLNPVGVIERITTNHNNSIARICNLEDYYAYDDGTAEKTFVMDQKFGYVAYRFDLAKDDTLVGIEFNVPYNTKSVDGESIDLVVWQDLDYPLGIGDSILHTEPIAIYLSDSLNSFNSIAYEYEIPVSDHFYVGWLVTGEEEVHFGYDVNNSANGKIWVKKDVEWSVFQDEGALMIRPIMDKNHFLNSPKKIDETFKIYPNPTKGLINISEKMDELYVYNQLGNLVLSEFYTSQLNLKNLPEGIYFLRIVNGNHVQNEKIILTK